MGFMDISYRSLLPVYGAETYIIITEIFSSYIHFLLQGRITHAALSLRVDRKSCGTAASGSSLCAKHHDIMVS